MRTNLLARSAVILAACATHILAASVPVAFWAEDRLTLINREAGSGQPAVEAAIAAMLAGPTDQEKLDGLRSAYPAGTSLNRLTVEDNTAVVDLSAHALDGLDEARMEAIYVQTLWTLRSAGLDHEVKLTVAGAVLSDYLPPAASVAPAPTRPSNQPPQAVTAAGSALAGKRISLSPGHGRRWSGSGWAYDRPAYCAPLSREDFHNVELTVYLNTFLLQDGAETLNYRCLDKGYGTYPVANTAWWRMSGSYWLQHLGYPCSVYASDTGDCTLGTGADESSDTIRSRPLASDLDDTDIHIAMHTNGYAGNCTGPGCPNGTATYYDSSAEHAAWGDISKNLGQKVNNAICTVIKNQYGDTDWYNRGAINANGNFAEARIPDRAAVLIETAFHDTCDRDALYLQDEYFRSAIMYGTYKGICNYFGVTPTFGFNSDEFVGDTIPSRMLPGRSYQVSITYRNRGVLWQKDKGYRLGAVGDADTFTALTRIEFSTAVDTGQEHTFMMTMTAPTTPGTYTTDWRMIREPSTWFGATHTEQVTVAWPDYDQDGDIDSADFGHLQACMAGADVPQLDPACQDARLDGDEDVDIDDFALFEQCASGPAVPINITCAQ